MLTSPDAYYEMNLKDKSEKEIRCAIRGLKNEIGHLKNIIEHPDYGSEPLMCPTEETRIWCARMYLERAKQALFKIGATYIPSQAEQKAQKFQENIDYITKITFKIGGYLGGFETYTINLEDEPVHYEADRLVLWDVVYPHETTSYPLSKAEFMDAFRELHIGEWRHYYDPERFGCIILDGTQWSLDIEYSNGLKAVRYEGSNSYPYNFYKLKELFGIEDDSE